MKSVSIALTITAVLITAVSAHAWLGETVSELSQTYGPPKAIDQSTGGDIPTNNGSYVELRDTTATNAIWMAPPKAGHYLELIENRERYLFNKSGTNIIVYIGDPNEKYAGTDYAGKSAREVIDCTETWSTNRAGDKVAYPIPFTPATVDALLADNKDNSAWSNEWHSIVTPGRFVKLSADKTREAIAYGPSTNQVYRLEIKMVNQLTTE